jgi:hypothetical protein
MMNSWMGPASSAAIRTVMVLTLAMASLFAKAASAAVDEETKGS